MPTETISQKQAFQVFALFLSGGIITIGGTAAGRGSWLYFMAAGLLALLLIYFYSEALYSCDDPLDVFAKAFGKGVGKVLCMLYALLAVHICAILMGVLSYFVTTVSLPRTPRILTALLVAVTIVLAVRRKVEVIARVSEMVFWIVYPLLALTILVAIPQVDVTAVSPIFNEGIGRVFNGIYSGLVLPFAEIFIAIAVLAPSIRKKECRRSACWAALFVALFLGLSFLVNMLVLDSPTVGEYYFPTYTAVSMVSLGSFFQRFEVFVSIAYLMSEIIKATLCLMFAHRCFVKVFPKTEKLALAPIGMVVLNLSALLFASIMQLFEWLRIYHYYLTVPLLVVPLIVYVVVKIKARKRPGELQLKGAEQG